MKTPKVKKRDVSIHSRAARRGASTASKDVAVKAPVEETDYKPWLHSAQNAGISKKKKTKQLTRQQKARQERSLEHAERNMDKHEKKVADSKTRGKKVNARRAEWDELNEKIAVGGKENQADSKGKQQVKKSVQDGKAMEGVEMPDLEETLAARATDDSAEGIEETGALPLPSSDDLNEKT